MAVDCLTRQSVCQLGERGNLGKGAFRGTSPWSWFEVCQRIDREIYRVIPFHYRASCSLCSETECQQRYLLPCLPVMDFSLGEYQCQDRIQSWNTVFVSLRQQDIYLWLCLLNSPSFLSHRIRAAVKYLCDIRLSVFAQLSVGIRQRHWWKTNRNRISPVKYYLSKLVSVREEDFPWPFFILTLCFFL